MRRTTGPPSVAPEANDTRFGGNLPMIAALVLAAGSSSRMGEPKPLVRLGDRPLLSRVLDAVRGSRVTQTVVVLGDSADRVRTELRFEGASVVENPEYRRGMSSSLKAGIASLDPATQAFFVVLGTNRSCDRRPTMPSSRPARRPARGSSCRRITGFEAIPCSSTGRWPPKRTR